MEIIDIHHVAIIGSDYKKSKHFYTEILGFKIIKETYRSERQSYKLDLAISEHVQLELFSFPSPPNRLTQPEACGLRHLAFKVDNVDIVRQELVNQSIACQEIRVDELTQKRFFFCEDPDHLPIEFYEL